MRLRDKIILTGILIVTALALSTLFWPAFGRAIDKEEIKLGLDLEGGAHFVYQADFSELPEGQSEEDAIDGVIAVIEKRVNAYGVSEPDIQKVGSDRIMIQLPGIDDIEEARELIGRTVLINFKEFKSYTPANGGSPAQVDDGVEPIQPVDSGSPTSMSSSGSPSEIDDDISPVLPIDSGSPAVVNDIESPVELISSGTIIYGVFLYDDEGKSEFVEVDKSEAQWMAIPATGIVNGEEIELTSQYFKDVEYDRNMNTGEPLVNFEWDSTGSDLFRQITAELKEPAPGLATPENRLGIFLGDDYVSAPVVKEVIEGSGEISGMSQSEAKRLVSLLNAGRIDVPLKTLEEHDVSATLGENFVDWSIQAGVIGLVLIILFLFLYYRLPGAVAGLALLIYVALVMAVYQLWPVVLTLAGIAGFILSIGMAVDANVLIFERMKEEIRLGRTVRAAVERGFNRAWPAIRDSNISTLITCLILYLMGDNLGVPAVQGFALTLAIGVGISMLSAIVVTRTFLRVIGSSGMADRQSLFMVATKGRMLSGEGR